MKCPTCGDKAVMIQGKRLCGWCGQNLEPVKVTFDVWLCFEGCGWWLEEEGYDSQRDALASLSDYADKPDVVGWCVIEKGKRPLVDQTWKPDRKKAAREAARKERGG